MGLHTMYPETTNHRSHVFRPAQGHRPWPTLLHCLMSHLAHPAFLGPSVLPSPSPVALCWSVSLFWLHALQKTFPYVRAFCADTPASGPQRASWLLIARLSARGPAIQPAPIQHSVVGRDAALPPVMLLVMPLLWSALRRGTRCTLELPAVARFAPGCG